MKFLKFLARKLVELVTIVFFMVAIFLTLMCIWFGYDPSDSKRISRAMLKTSDGFG